MVAFLLNSCFDGCQKREKGETIAVDNIESTKPAAEIEDTGGEVETHITTKSEMAMQLDSMGLVEVKELDSTFLVEMVYATTDNFTGEVLYYNLTEAYLLPEVADALISAHDALKIMMPDHHFLIYDAARPMSAQRKMRDVAVSMGKGYYVANPANGGGLHNYGAAVDLTIVDKNGTPLSMGSGYDYFGKEANIDRESALVAEGKITQEELNNRLLLRSLMVGAGFRTITSEWWHFNYCSRTEAMARYELINF